MNQKNILKQAVVLLLIVLMIVSSGAVGVNTSDKNANIIQKDARLESAPLSRALVWDNVVGVYGALGGVIVAVVRPDGIAFPADDFMLDTTSDVNKIFWQGGYFQCELAQGMMDYNWDWRVLFWDDIGDGTNPGTVIHNFTIPTASIEREHWYNWTNPSTLREYWVANYSANLPETVTFNADTKYWITMQGIGAYPPQACWSRHNDSVGGILLHQAVFMGVLWGFPDWVDISSVVTDGLPHDLNYQLFYEAEDETPPVTTCTITGTTEKTITLTATDDLSGVDFTKYKLDVGAWTDYTAAFVVSEIGDHIVYFYSVDKAGNVEAEKNKTFTVESPIAITIKGGLGVSATIKNIGTTDLTDIDWKIELVGKLIFVGKTKNGTIDTLAVGAEVTVKDFVVGFGSTQIIGDCGGATDTKSGFVLLFFVIGVK
jgi:hypothetical protein